MLTQLDPNQLGCQWQFRPHELLPQRNVSQSFARWRDEGTWARMLDTLRVQGRRHTGREATPGAAGSDSQSVKTTAVGGSEHGSDDGKHVTGRTRHLLVVPMKG